MAKYQIIGREVEVNSDAVGKEEVQTAVEGIHDVFREMAAVHTRIKSVDAPGGGIRCTWILTLLSLECQRLRDGGIAFVSDDKTRYAVNLLVCGQRFSFRITVDKEPLYRTAAEQINKRYSELAKCNADEGDIWRHMALESVLKCRLNE